MPVENEKPGLDRRELIKLGAGVLGVAAGALVIGCGGSAGLSTNGGSTASTASTATTGATSTTAGSTGGNTGGFVDSDFINFLLNLEYIKAQYYLIAATGTGLSSTQTGPNSGTVNGGSQVSFSTSTVQGLCTNIAEDEVLHVNTLRGLNGTVAVAMPNIDFTNGFKSLGNQCGLGTTFNAFSNEENFLLGSFFFEDPVVTAQYGAIEQLTTPTNAVAMIGMMGTDAYHAGAVRHAIYAYNADALAKAGQISAFRASVGGGDDAAPIISTTLPNIAPHDVNGYIYARVTRLVENIFYLTSGAASGGFFPGGFAGNIISSLRRRR